MLWRHLCLVRAWSAAGLLSSLMVFGGSLAPAQTTRPVDPESSSPPAAVVTDTVEVLKGSKAGDLSVVARGAGQERVKLTIRNTSGKRLNVILPPGLVAASAAGQGRGGLQSMGLGAPSNRLGSFGQFRGAGVEGLQSVPIDDPTSASKITIPASETTELVIPAVCLNFGLPTPTPRDTFTLMDVDDYSPDVRVRKSLRSLVLLGTSLGVAQSVMWRVCNDVAFETMAAQGAKIMNEHEIALAARFVDAVDASGSDLVDPASLTEGRVFVRVLGEGSLAREARRLSDQMEKQRLLGLPVRALDSGELPTASAPAMFIKVVLTDTKIGETRGRLLVSYCSQPDQWTSMGKVTFQENSSLAVLDGQALCKALDRTLASAFVNVRPAKRSAGSTTLKVENHLPFTLAAIGLRAGGSAGAPTVPFPAIGVGPARTALVPIQAASATIESVELNGL